ncbi:hypothetical protein ACIBJC_15355 [Streptomyces sp. NPDC050509]|uniref:hypothetical protein n=1 Tax=Streptomyces sp. NPDC050509 TaxID=3365620 RepID=UPI0037AD9264
MDIAGVAAAVVGLVVGVLGWTQSRATNRRSDFTTITERLDRELRVEREQRRIQTYYLVALVKWGRRVAPEGDPVPEPPPELDLSPWA